MLPCVLHEDADLLVVNKPAGLNTHAPSPYAPEGIYDFLKHREPRWATLAIIHRLDKETSGVIVFSKSPAGNRSLTRQFTERGVHKTYLLQTDRRLPEREFTIKTGIRRAGEKYVPTTATAEHAETHFSVLEQSPSLTTLAAHPVTGRTHQIRVHAAHAGFPILGDRLYGGTASTRVHLHAQKIQLLHPSTNELCEFAAPADFRADPRVQRRDALIEPEHTNANRLLHGAADGFDGAYLDRLGDFLLIQSEIAPTPAQMALVSRLDAQSQSIGTYDKRLSRAVRGKLPETMSPRLLSGQAAPAAFSILENGIRYSLSFEEGYSVGLFLDQRDNRRRLLTRHVAAGFDLFHTDKPEVLNTFAYTCGFSVCAAKAGARTTSLDLSRKYLDWGRRNFLLNDLDADQHDFIYGDTFDWLRRFQKKQRRFDLLILDPPTFSQSKESGVFRAEKDFGKLVSAAVPLLKPGGVLFASCNAAAWPPQLFMDCLDSAIATSGRRVTQSHYCPQPPDFPVSKTEPAYLKTAWLRLN